MGGTGREKRAHGRSWGAVVYQWQLRDWRLHVSKFAQRIYKVTHANFAIVGE